MDMYITLPVCCSLFCLEKNASEMCGQVVGGKVGHANGRAGKTREGAEVEGGGFHFLCLAAVTSWNSWLSSTSINHFAGKHLNSYFQELNPLKELLDDNFTHKV